MIAIKNLILITVFFILSKISAQIETDLLLNLKSAQTTAEMNAVTNVDAGTLIYNVQERGVYVFDGTNWISVSANNWLINGNAGTTNSNFLGTTDDVRMQIRSNNLPLLEFGRRETLNLVQGFPDYTDTNQPLVHLNGNGNISALQFAAAGAAFYKPMFFTTPNGSFRLKGSSGSTDLFEIGSAGPANGGRLEFVVGDDGLEPIIFKRYHFSGPFTRELFRVQGSNNTADAKTRFGINLNTTNQTLDPEYDDPDTGIIANSTFQVDGSVSTAITTTTTNFILNEDNHTVILGGNHSVTLPAANTCSGRFYVIKNPTNFVNTISNGATGGYINTSGNDVTTILSQSVLWVQSDGTNWQQVNSEITGPTVYTGFFIINGSGTTSIYNIPFQPSLVVFKAHPNLRAFDINDDNGVGNNTGLLENTFGAMNGYARNDGTSINQAVIFSGGSGSSINNISRYTNQNQCIGLRYTNNNGQNLGLITAQLTAFVSNGFNLNITYTQGVVGNAAQQDDILDEDLIIFYTAYR